MLKSDKPYKRGNYIFTILAAIESLNLDLCVGFPICT